MLRGPATVVLLGVLVGGCGRVAELATPPSPLPVTAPDPGAGAVAQANQRLAAVAEAQRTLEPDLDAALALAADVDALVTAVRDPAQVEEALSTAAAVGERLTTGVPDARLDTLRAAVDDAGSALDDASALLGPDARWEAEWLDAQAQVLAAVEARARATAEVLVALGDHRAAAVDVLGVVTTVDEQRDRYRDGQELAGTIEVDAAGPLARLARADDELAAATARRAEATAVLNTADAAAAEVFARRPDVAPAVDTS